ncbi:Uncharacterised protein [Bordetella pertussis]|nr:Uncharacterised protein [Bordetella pertussis]CFW07470.1 Uncharacterised protein [Bordetella pertussis]CPM64575.1 Uncharacterised protein [Bordetella pertussis]CPN30891.1 Uncharacterised protein [Bordetella pertussis]CPO14481.1 Uncharacterised protein [Bordetella pertussis]
MPTARRSAPMASATLSALPRPFWMVSTRVSGPSMARACAAALPAWAALTAMMIRSTGSAGASR